MHRLPERTALDLLIKHKGAQSLHIGIRLTVGRSRLHLMDHPGSTADGCFDYLIVCILLPLDPNLRVDRGSAEPEIGIIPLIRRLSVHRYPGHVGQQLLIECLHVLVVSKVIPQHRHLSATDAGADIREAVVVSDGGMVVVRIGITRLGGIPHDLRRVRLRATDQRSSARGGDHLISIEREDTKPSEGAQHLTIIAGAHPLSSILHHGDAVLIRYRHDLIDPVGHTIERHGNDRLGVPSGLLLTV